jgi:hypothetical protein
MPEVAPKVAFDDVQGTSPSFLRVCGIHAAPFRNERFSRTVQRRVSAPTRRELFRGDPSIVDTHRLGDAPSA